MTDLDVLVVQPRLCSRGWKEAKALTDAGARVSLVEFDGGSPIMDYDIFVERTTLPYAPDSVSMIRQRRGIVSRIKQHVAAVGPDLVHTHNGPDCLGAWLAPALQVPLVHDIHDLVTATPTTWPATARFHKLKGKAFDHLHRRWERRAARGAAGVMTTSPAMAELVAKRHQVTRILSLENKPIRQPFTRLPKRSAHDGELHVAYAGGVTLEPGSERELLPVFDAMAASGLHVHLYLVAYNDATRAAVENRAAHNPRIHLHDPIPQHEFIQEMSQYDGGMIWFTTMNENIRVTTQNKLFEFQVAGVPIITNMTDGYTADHIRARQCGVAVAHAGDAAAALAQLAGPRADVEDCFMDGHDILDFYATILADP